MSQLATRNVVSLRREWRLFDKDNAPAEHFLSLLERMVSVGEFLLAHDVARIGLLNHKNHKELSQRAAHALCKAGSPYHATQVLEELVASGISDVETQSLLASAYKDLCENTEDPQKKQEYADLAIARYEKGYFQQGQPEHGHNDDNLYYPCINVAFMHFVCRSFDKAREYAESAQKLCRELREKGKSNYWVEATIAEAYLLLGRIDEAIHAYADAVELSDANPSYIASTRKQALQISSLYEDPSIRERIILAFPTLGIVACSGHLIDSPGKTAGFLRRLKPLSGLKLKKIWIFWELPVVTVLRLVGPILSFLKRWHRGGETHVFLPFAKDKFIQSSVRREGTDWEARFEKVLDQATSVHYVTSEGYYGDDSLFSFCNDVMLGFAAMRARGLDEEPNLLLFWDGNSGQTGGTGEVAESWRNTFNEPVVISADEVLYMLDQLDEPSIPLATGNTRPIFNPSFGESHKAMRSVKTMIFADVGKFSKVNEENTTHFVEVFHGSIAKMIQDLGCTPEFINSWGDSFFAVFNDVGKALDLAMAMRDFSLLVIGRN